MRPETKAERETFRKERQRDGHEHKEKKTSMKQKEQCASFNRSFHEGEAGQVSQLVRLQLSPPPPPPDHSITPRAPTLTGNRNEHPPADAASPEPPATLTPHLLVQSSVVTLATR